jgi:hypothetical protein
MKLLIELDLDGETVDEDATWAVNKALDSGVFQDAIRDVSLRGHGGLVTVGSVVVRYDDPDVSHPCAPRAHVPSEGERTSWHSSTA